MIELLVSIGSFIYISLGSSTFSCKPISTSANAINPRIVQDKLDKMEFSLFLFIFETENIKDFFVLRASSLE